MWSIGGEHIEFLDLNILKEGRFNTTDHLDRSIHFKSTNTFQYLHFSSSHPRSVLKGFVKGEAIQMYSRTTTHNVNLYITFYFGTL